MQNWYLINSSRLGITLIVILGLLLWPTSRQDSHNPMALDTAELALHTELTAHSEVHGHSHDDHDIDGLKPSHSHGHNPTDHTHETASVLPCFAQPILQSSRTWVSWPLAFADLETRYRLERPPRQIVIA